MGFCGCFVYGPGLTNRYIPNSHPAIVRSRDQKILGHEGQGLLAPNTDDSTLCIAQRPGKRATPQNPHSYLYCTCRYVYIL